MVELFIFTGNTVTTFFLLKAPKLGNKAKHIY